MFRIRLARGSGGLSETFEAACEQVGQVPKENFVADHSGRVLPLGRRLDDAVLEAVIAAVVNVLKS